jgi:flagellar basal-body rod protein FlgG
MAAQQSVLDAIAANLSNSDVPGYRSDRPEFAVQSHGDRRFTSAATVRRLFTQGRLESTSSDDDLAISGEGLFSVRTSDRKIAFTRAGNFTRNADGRLALPNGATLRGVLLPHGAISFAVSSDGRVRARVIGKPQPVDAGRISLSAFSDNASLMFGQDGLFYAGAAAGQRYEAPAGTAGFGTIRQRCLERSNVSIVAAMMSILSAQRAYEANAKSVQAADEMLRLANNLQRG